MEELAYVGLCLNAGKTVVLTNEAQPPQCLILTNQDAIVVKGNDVGHKWLGCILSAGAYGRSTLDTTYHVQAASRAFFANKQILCDKKVRFAVRLRFFDRVITPVALFASGHRTIRMSDLYKLDVVFRKMLRMIVGPPSFVDWNAPWLEILHHWNGKAVALAQQHGVNPWSEQCLKHHWKFAMHVANLPSNRWVKRVLLWNPCGARTRGYPRHVWTSKLVAYTRFHQLGCIEAMGMNYGLRLNWKKCEVLPIGCEASIAAPDGSYLTCKSSISYLGSYLDATGAGGPEICRRSKVNSTNWRESGGILPCTPNKRSVSSKLVSCQSCCIACTQCG